MWDDICRHSAVRPMDRPRANALEDLAGCAIAHHSSIAPASPGMTDSPNPTSDRKETMTTPTPFLGIISGDRKPQPRRGRRSRRPHRRRIAKARRRAGRQRLHPDAQRHRLHRGGLCRDAARRLWRAGQLAFQAGGNQLHPEGFRNAGPDRPCRHAASVARRHSRRGHRAQRADAAGNPGELQDRSGASRHARFCHRFRTLAASAGAL